MTKTLPVLAIVFALAAVLLGWAQEPQAGNAAFREAAPAALTPIFEGEIPPGDYAAFRWHAHRLVAWKVPGSSLTEKASQALALSPKWLGAALASKLSSLPPESQDALSEVVLSAVDWRFIDEMAFCIAYLPMQELTAERFDPRILAENARLIYEAGRRLDYVELVETGEPTFSGDWKTTARYRLQGAEGAEEYYELPCEVYYWYVVLPKFGREQVKRIDPVTGEPVPPESGGVFWRGYMMHEDSDPRRCASTHFLMEHPHLIERVPSCAERAEFALADLAVDPIPLIVDSGGAPLLCTFAWPGDQMDAQVIATTIPVELDASQDGRGLLENLLRAGSASAMLDPGIVPEGFDDVRIAILKDRNPFGEPIIERALSSMGFKFSVFSSDRIAEMLAPESGFIKVVIPSGQPRLFYERLAESEPLWRDWMKTDELSRNRVVEFHGASDPAHPGDDWRGLRMPWGFSCAPLAAGELAVAGYPRLLDLLSGTRFLWNHRPLTVGGDEAVSGDTCALELIGYFVTQNQPDRCAEVPFYYRGPDADAGFEGDAAEYVQSLRSPYPQRSLYLHYGNCGEVGDLLSSAGRTALVPVRDAVTHPVDHVWNQVYLEGKWRSYTVFRSDCGIRFDDGVYTEKNHIAVMACRSDGYVDNIIREYFDSTFFAEVRVTDANGRPVDGATVTVMTDWTEGEPPPKTHAGMAWTDLSGVARVELGVGKDFFVQVYTPLEDCPELVADDSEKAAKDTEPRKDPVAERRRQKKPAPALLVPADGSEAGKTVHHQVSLHFALPEDRATVDSAAYPEVDRGALLALNVPARILHGYSSYYDCDFTREEAGGSVDLYVMDAENFHRFAASEPCQAARVLQQVDSSELPLPSSDDEWFVVVSNRSRMAYGQVARLTVESTDR